MASNLARSSFVMPAPGRFVFSVSTSHQKWRGAITQNSEGAIWNWVTAI
jgi:hypothetical protein